MKPNLYGDCAECPAEFPEPRTFRGALRMLHKERIAGKRIAEQTHIEMTSMANIHHRLEVSYRNERQTLVAALKDAVAFMDRLNGKKHGGEWTVKDVKRIEEIRLLSLGI